VTSHDSDEPHGELVPEADLIREAVQTLDAIRRDTIDGYVVTTPAGERVVLAGGGSERPYQLMVDGMSEGAATVATDGTVLYANRRLGEMLGRNGASLTGCSFFSFVEAQHGSVLRAVFEDGVDAEWRGDVVMHVPEAGDVPVHLSITSLTLGDGNVVRSLLLADLRDQRRTDAIVAEGRLAKCILEQASEAIVVCDQDGIVRQVNREALRLSAGRDPRGQPFIEAFAFDGSDDTPELADLLRGHARRVRARGAGRQSAALQLMVSAAPLHGADGRALGSVVTLSDLTELHQATERLERYARHQRWTSELSRAALAGARLPELMESCRTALSAMLEGATVRITGAFENADPAAVTACADANVVRRAIATSDALLGHVEVDPGEGRCLAADDVGFVETIASLLCLTAERQGLTDKLHYQAHHDALTGLPNRALLEDRLQQALARAARDGTHVAVLFIDIDRFKQVNDTFGHEVGDNVLVEIASRLRRHVRSSDTIARVGGDEFVMVHADLASAELARAIAVDVIETLAQPLRLERRSVKLRATVGISIYPIDGSDASTLLMASDTAMYHGKRGGRNTIRHFEREMYELATVQRDLEYEFHAALSGGKLELHFQPQVSARSGTLRGIEALARWRHPRRGWIEPSRFVPVAEELGLVTEFGTWALQEACRQAAPWLKGAAGPQRVSVNVSPTQCMRPDFIDVVAAALRGADLQPCHLELEVTEGIVLHDIDTVIRRLADLRALGVRIALDDFGIGYSSVGTLRKLPLDRLKIDKAFVELDDGGSTTRDEQRAVLSAITTLAQTFGLLVTVEGIETEAQLEMARGVGCDDVQGYLLGRPRSAAAVGTPATGWRLARPPVSG
jgi:diguanylate cyclase (GGDEF)-like protein